MVRFNETPKSRLTARWGSMRSDSSTQADNDSPMTHSNSRPNRRRTLEERNEGRSENESNESDDETEEPSRKPYFLYN